MLRPRDADCTRTSLTERPSCGTVLKSAPQEGDCEDTGGDSHASRTTGPDSRRRPQVRSVRTGALALTAALCIPGCAAQIPSVPRKVCDVDVNQSKVTPLLPEGEKAEVTRLDGSYGRTVCSIYIDDTKALEIEHHNRLRKLEKRSPFEVTGRAKTFKGNLDLHEFFAVAEARCHGKKNGVYTRVAFADVTADPEKWEKLEPDARPNMEAFLNSYVPGVLKHYGCN